MSKKRSSLANAFSTPRRVKPTSKGMAGYDNARENIDPHIKTKVVNAKILYADGRIVDRSSDVLYSTVTVANTTVETLLWTGVVPANSLLPGAVLDFFASGLASNASASDILAIRVKIGGVTKVTLTNSARNFSDDDLHLVGDATQRTIGVAGSRAIHFDFSIGIDTSNTTTVATVDTTSNMNISITAQWNNAKAGNTISLYQASMTYKN